MSTIRVNAWTCIVLGAALLSAPVPACSFQLGEPVQVPVEGTYMRANWAPDGSGLALAGERFTGLYYTDPAGNFTTISDQPMAGWQFAWSPDGQNLAYRVRQPDGMGMAVMVAGRGQEGSKQITPWLNDMFPPKWGKDGLTYRSGDELVTVDKDGKVLKVHSLSQGRGLLSRMISVAGAFMLGRLTGATFTSFGCALSSQAADGKAGQGVFIDSESQIWVVDENGNRKKLIDVEGEVGYATPVESPQGDKYAIHGYSGDLYVADAHGGSPVNLGKGSSPTWSPDGRYIMYEITTDNGHVVTSSQFYISSIDGMERFELPNGDQIMESPCWSPDGKYISYIVNGRVYIAPISR